MHLWSCLISHGPCTFRCVVSPVRELFKKYRFNANFREYNKFLKNVCTRIEHVAFVGYGENIRRVNNIWNDGYGDDYILISMQNLCSSRGRMTCTNSHQKQP